MKQMFRSQGPQQRVLHQVVGDFCISSQGPSITAQLRNPLLNTLLKHRQSKLPESINLRREISQVSEITQFTNKLVCDKLFIFTERRRIFHVLSDAVLR